MKDKDIDRLCINTIRFLAVDMVEKAKSGHPGLPLGAAPMGYILFDRILRYNPANPQWFNRDRFILSAGHGCALQYALLHLTGYDLPLEELKRFRQFGSKTPGHPEYGVTPGVEVTTGPLGQGFGMGVGMAIAERYLAAYFNRPDHLLVDHYTYGIASDGDLMEGVSSEAASLAGHLGLGKLIYLYDDNNISIDGNTRITFTENVGQRFEAYGWHVDHVADGNDLGATETAIQNAIVEKDRPSLIIVRTHIGFGSPKQDSAKAHGEPLGKEAAEATKRNLGWPLDPPFYIPDEALIHMRLALQRGEQMEDEWENIWDRYQRHFPDLAKEFEQAIKGELPDGWDSNLPKFAPDSEKLATREASGKVMNAIAPRIPTFIGGSADLAASTRTDLKDGGDFEKNNRKGRNLRFGVREHAMGTIANGLARHHGIIPFTGTFLVFSDYMRPALRIASLMKAHAIFIFTHDSIGLGEDGPTHQPVGHLLSLRAIPGMTVIRPADANETTAAWRLALLRKSPTALAFSRQKLPILDADKFGIAEGVVRGGYTLAESENLSPELILIGTGAEVHLILNAQKQLTARGIGTRTVSMPSQEIFEEQPQEYREKILSPELPKLIVEAADPQSWYKYAGSHGDVIGLDRFGASAPGAEVLEKLGFTAENVMSHTLRLLKKAAI